MGGGGDEEGEEGSLSGSMSKSISFCVKCKRVTLHPQSQVRYSRHPVSQ